MTARILQGDCLDLLRGLPADSVQCVVTSPPYWGLRDYGVAGQIGLEESLVDWVDKLVLVFREVRRVLKPDGLCWVNLGDSYCGGARASYDDSSPNKGHQPPNTRNVRRSFRRDGEPTPRSDLRVAGLKPKDLIGQPWMVAFALRADGWWLRDAIVWAKPNPMPESVTDRCTKSYEMVFMLAKSERYYFNAEAIKEPASPDTHARYARGRSDDHNKPVAGWANAGSERSAIAHAQPKDDGDSRKMLRAASPKYDGAGEDHRTKQALAAAERKARPRKTAEPGSGTKNNASFDAAMAVMPESRNKRNVWTIPTEGYPGAHFATYPTALVRPCILASTRGGDTVLDPFNGSGTTGQVALELGRQYIGLELNPAYVELTHKRLRWLELGLPLTVEACA